MVEVAWVGGDHAPMVPMVLPSAHPGPGAPHYTGPATALELQTKVIERYAKISQLQKSLTRAFSSLKATSSTFTFKTLLSHYAKQTLDPW